jgi:small subunit ribosomal protein S18
MRKTKTTTKKPTFTNTKSQCFFTQTSTKPNYKDVLVLRRFVNDRSKILPQKYTLLTSKNQRLLEREIKKSRFMGLLPYTDKHAI